MHASPLHFEWKRVLRVALAAALVAGMAACATVTTTGPAGSKEVALDPAFVQARDLANTAGTLPADQVAANRRKFRGTLEKADTGWQLTWSDEPEPAPGVRVSKKKKEPAPLQVLGFTLDELKEARLAPIVDFKGRKRAGVQEQGK